MAGITENGTVRLLAAYGATLVTFTGLDALWLTFVGVGQFQSHLGAMLEPRPDLTAAAGLYLIVAFGLVVLAVRPALQAGAIETAAFNGAVLGLSAYATFDLTCLAILKGYTPGLALVDIAWGTVLAAVGACAGYLAASRFGSTPTSGAAGGSRP